jgi:hypothetical protein
LDCLRHRVPVRWARCSPRQSGVRPVPAGG